MHLAVYRTTEATAIVHTHSPFVVALSTVLDELPAAHYAMAGLGGLVRVVPSSGSAPRNWPRAPSPGLAGRTAVILRNHGALTYGAAFQPQAYGRAQTLEWLARVYWHARLAGGPRDALTRRPSSTRSGRRRERSGTGSLTQAHAPATRGPCGPG